MSKLTTHVLDTFHGRPAAGVLVELSRRGSDARPVASARTNPDGRCPAPLLEGADFVGGTSGPPSQSGDSSGGRGMALPEPPFLDVVVIHVGLAAGAGPYHVPLVVTPWSYSTYRGS